MRNLGKRQAVWLALLALVFCAACGEAKMENQYDPEFDLSLDSYSLQEACVSWGLELTPDGCQAVKK